MLSTETEAKIAKLFMVLAEGENNSEIIRQVISEQPNFDPYLLFKKIDKGQKNFIDEYDFVDYLKEHSVNCTPCEAILIIAFYDTNNNGTLNYFE